MSQKNIRRLASLDPAMKVSFEINENPNAEIYPVLKSHC